MLKYEYERAPMALGSEELDSVLSGLGLHGQEVYILLLLASKAGNGVDMGHLARWFQYAGEAILSIPAHTPPAQSPNILSMQGALKLGSSSAYSLPLITAEKHLPRLSYKSCMKFLGKMLSLGVLWCESKEDYAKASALIAEAANLELGLYQKSSESVKVLISNKGTRTLLALTQACDGFFKMKMNMRGVGFTDFYERRPAVIARLMGRDWASENVNGDIREVSLFESESCIEKSEIYEGELCRDTEGQLHLYDGDLWEIVFDEEGLMNCLQDCYLLHRQVKLCAFVWDHLNKVEYIQSGAYTVPKEIEVEVSKEEETSL